MPAESPSASPTVGNEGRSLGLACFSEVAAPEPQVSVIKSFNERTEKS